MDKFESHSSNGLFLGYADHSRAYRTLKLETNRVVETCEMTFDESIPCANSGFELAGDDELGLNILEEDIVVDAGVQAEDDGSVTFMNIPLGTAPGSHTLHILLLLPPLSPEILDMLYLMQIGLMPCMRSWKTLREIKFGP